MKDFWICLLLVWMLFAVPAGAAENPADPVNADFFPAYGEEAGTPFLFRAAGAFPDYLDKIDLLTALAVFFAAVSLLLLIALLLLNRHYRHNELIYQNRFSLQQVLQNYLDMDEYIVYLKDENLKYIFASPSIEKCYQKKAKDLIGLDDYALSNEEHASRRRALDLQVIEKKTLITDEVYWEGAYYRISKFPVTLRNGKTGVGAVIRDISEEKTKLKSLEMILNRQKIIVDIVSLSFQSTREQLDYALNRLIALTESKFGYIFLYQEETEEPIECFWSNRVSTYSGLSEREIHFTLDKSGIWGEAARQRKPVFINRFDQPYPWKKKPAGQLPLTRFLSVPIIDEEKIVAVLGLANKETDYTEEDANEISLIMMTVWNTVKRREAQDKLVYERNKYLQTLVSIGDGVLVADRSGNIEMLNNIAERLTGWTLSEALGKHYSEVFRLSYKDGDAPAKDPVQVVLESNTPYQSNLDSILIAKDGARYDIEDSASPIKDSGGKLLGVVLVFRDVTDKREHLKKIAFLSYHDCLTGLFNRSFIEEELQRIDLENTLPITILIGDVNVLKLTNDIFGHQYGDELLRRTARVMQECFRDTDILARWGGDEFVALLPKTDYEQAERIVAAVKEKLSKERIKALQGSISIGMFTMRCANRNIWDALSRAEQRMYRAKAVDRGYIQSGTLHSLIQFLRENNPREKEHAEAVEQLCVRLGKRLDFSEIELKRLKEAAYLHDIGKIALNPSLLNRTFQRTDKEWSEVKKHPIIGYRILNFFDNTLDLAQIVLHHQERWDGSGYPKGSKGEEIPLHSRIIAIAESYERSISGSDNRKPLSKQDALTRLQNGAGSHFDPHLTEVFLAMMREQEEP